MSTPVASTPTTRAPMRSSTPRCSSSLAALADSWSPKVARGSLPPSSRTTRIDEASKERNSPRRLRTASSRTWPASSTPVGPAPTMATVSQRSRSAGSVGHLRHLEGAEDPPPQFQGVVDGLHAGRVEGELVVPEVGLVDPGGHDQAVVGDLEGLRCRRRWSCTIAPVQVEAGDLGQLHPDVLVLANHVAQGRRDLAGRDQSGRHLIEQRLEQVVVAPVDQRDLDRLAGQPVGSRAGRRSLRRRSPPGDARLR